MHHKTNVTSNSGSTQFASQRRHRLIPIVGTLALLWLTAGTAQATSVNLIFLPNGTPTIGAGGVVGPSITSPLVTCSGGTPGTRPGTIVNGVCDSFANGDTLVFAVQFQVDAAGVNAWSVDLGWDASLNNVLTTNGVTPVASFVRGFANPSPPPTVIGYTVQPTVAIQQSSPTQGGYVQGVSGGLTQDFGLTVASTSFVGSTVTFTVDATIGGANLGLGFLATDGASMGNSASQFITPTFGSFAIDVNTAGRGDFNGDGFADVLIQNEIDRTLYVFITDPAGGVNATLSGPMAQLPADWEVEDIADVNGDGQADIILTYTGIDATLRGLIYVYITTPTAVPAVAVSVITGGEGTSTSGMAGNSPTNWELASVGDANGDGLADFYLKATATAGSYCQGSVYVYISQATKPFFEPGAGGLPFGSSSSDGACTNSDVWDLVSVGDLNGDGATDAVLAAVAGGSSGLVTIGDLFYAISDVSGLGWSGQGVGSMPVTGWSVVGLGYDARNNSSDFVISEDVSNDVWVFRTNALGNGYAGGGFPCTGAVSCTPFDIPPGYRLRGLDDYNGDGVYDFLLEQISGCVANPGGNSCQVIVYETHEVETPKIASSSFYGSLNNAEWVLPIFEGYSATP